MQSALTDAHRSEMIWKTSPTMSVSIDLITVFAKQN